MCWIPGWYSEGSGQLRVNSHALLFSMVCCSHTDICYGPHLLNCMLQFSLTRKVEENGGWSLYQYITSFYFLYYFAWLVCLIVRQWSKARWVQGGDGITSGIGSLYLQWWWIGWQIRSGVSVDYVFRWKKNIQEGESCRWQDWRC